MNENDSKTRSTKTWRSVIQFLVVAVVLAGLGYAVHQSWIQWQDQIASIRESVEQIDLQLKEAEGPQQRAELETRRNELLQGLPGLDNVRWDRLVIAGLVYSLGLVPPAWVLCWAVRWMGQSCDLSIAVAAQIIGHLGKYVPGKAMVVVMRVGVLKKHGVSVGVGTAAVFMETLLMMAVGGFIGALLVWHLPVPRWIRFGALAVACVSVFPTLPPVMTALMNGMAKRRESKSGVGGASQSSQKSTADGSHPEVETRLTAWQLFGVGWISSALAWFAIVTSFSLLVTAIPGPESHGLREVFLAASAAICLAVVLGFVSLIPGGIGVRELVLTAVLAPMVGVSQAMLAAISARMLYLLAECVCVAISWNWLDRRKGPEESAPPNPLSSKKAMP